MSTKLSVVQLKVLLILDRKGPPEFGVWDHVLSELCELGLVRASKDRRAAARFLLTAAGRRFVTQIPTAGNAPPAQSTIPMRIRKRGCVERGKSSVRNGDAGSPSLFHKLTTG